MGTIQHNAVEIRRGVARIDVSTRGHPGKIALIDAADVPLVCDGRGRWRYHAGGGGSAQRNSPDGRNGEIEHLARVILGAPLGRHVRYLGRDKLDCRRASLALSRRA